MTRLFGSRKAQETEQSPALPSLGVLFGTHNRVSCELILSELVASGLAKTVPAPGGATDVIKLSDAGSEQVAIGQLYGASC